MAVNAYLVIDERPGPSTSRPGAIDILSFKFGASQTAVIGASAPGGQTRAGQASIDKLSLVKMLDKASPLLWDDLTTGNVLSKATLFYGKPTGEGQADYFKIEMEEVIITGLRHSASSEVPTESLELAFAKTKFCYNPEDAQGNLAGWVEKGFDLKTLKPY